MEQQLPCRLRLGCGLRSHMLNAGGYLAVAMLPVHQDVVGLCGGCRMRLPQWVLPFSPAAFHRPFFLHRFCLLTVVVLLCLTRLAAGREVGWHVIQVH